MFGEFTFVSKELLAGKSVLRAYLNYRLKDEVLKGKTIDIGGGRSEQYISCMKQEESLQFQTLDLKNGQDVDFEKDRLPSDDCVYDTVLFLNVMEHIFNYQHIANEVVRIIKPTGQLIGYVPFLMWYHPDHRDFFRYTHEALEIIFTKAGAFNIVVEPIAKGPFTICLNTINHLFPRILRPFIFLIVFVLDELFLKFQNKPDKRYALGYFFKISK